MHVLHRRLRSRQQGMGRGAWPRSTWPSARSVPWAKAGVGAVATQSFVNVDLRAQGARTAGRGQVGRGSRQDADRRRRGQGASPGRRSSTPRANVATFTGKKCNAWAGGKTGKNYACQGNLLAGEEVVDEMAKAFEDSEGAAGLAADGGPGGRREGRRRQARQAVGGHPGRPRQGAGPTASAIAAIDLRVDDHENPMQELARILALRHSPPVKGGE